MEEGALYCGRIQVVDKNSNIMHNVLLSRGGVPEWPKGPDCKSDGSAFVGSNPTPSTTNELGMHDW